MSAALIGIDTNIVARIILRDDDSQYQHCLKLLENARANGPLMLNPLVIAEVVWLLERRFKIARADARGLVRGISESAEMFVPDALATGGMDECLTSGHPEFFDVFIAHTNRANGCDFTYTFDKRAARDVPGMKLLQ